MIDRILKTYGEVNKTANGYPPEKKNVGDVAYYILLASKMKVEILHKLSKNNISKHLLTSISVDVITHYETHFRAVFLMKNI